MKMLLGFAVLLCGQTLSDDNFDTLRDRMVPPKEELRWRELPWHPTLWDGMLRARQDNKPVLLYAMNGHPCGHT